MQDRLFFVNVRSGSLMTLYITVTLLKQAKSHVDFSLVYGPSYNHTHNYTDFKKLYDHSGRGVISYFSGTRKWGQVTVHCLMNSFQRHPPTHVMSRVILHDHVYHIFEKVELIQPKGFRISIPLLGFASTGNGKLRKDVKKSLANFAGNGRTILTVMNELTRVRWIVLFVRINAYSCEVRN